VRVLPALLRLWLSLALLQPVAAHPMQQAGADARRLVAYTSPSGAQFQGDERLIPGLDILARLDEGRPLLNALAQGRVLIIFAADELDEMYGYYDDTLRLIAIDPGLREIDPRALARAPAARGVACPARPGRLCEGRCDHARRGRGVHPG
jgi:hypothetical protein